jgi:hypothetical protein
LATTLFGDGINRDQAQMFEAQNMIDDQKDVSD